MREQGTDPDKGGEALDSMIDGMSGTGRDVLGEQLDAMKDVLGADAAADMASVLSSPDYLFRVLYDPYFSGQAAVHKIRRAGGWAAVNELWRNPPTSTEMLDASRQARAGTPRRAGQGRSARRLGRARSRL